MMQRCRLDELRSLEAPCTSELADEIDRRHCWRLIVIVADKARIAIDEGYERIAQFNRAHCVQFCECDDR